jgi:hypothetical protein
MFGGSEVWKIVLMLLLEFGGVEVKGDRGAASLAERGTRRGAQGSRRGGSDI